VIIPY